MSQWNMRSTTKNGKKKMNETNYVGVGQTKMKKWDKLFWTEGVII